MARNQSAATGETSQLAKEPAWTEGEFEIRLGRAPYGLKHTLKDLNGLTVKVHAYFFGPLAVTPKLFLGLPSMDEVYDVTHVATSFALGRRLSLSRAKELAEKVASLDWNFTDPAKMPKATSAACLRIFKEGDYL